jgi:putative transposase
MRAVTDAALTAKIHAAHAASNGTYGAPRLQIDLAEAGIRVGRKRVARLMRNAGSVGVSRRKSTITTARDGARQAPDLVDRNFTADRPNLLWVADITYIPTWAGFLYWRLCSMRSAVGLSAGRWRPPCTRSSCSMPLRWRSGSGGRTA